MIRALLCLLYLFPVTLLAVQGDVELQIEKQDELWISQRVTAKLIVKTDAFAIRDLTVKTPSSEEFIIVKPDSAAYTSTETVEDTQWQHTVYEYEIYPMRAGQMELQTFQVQFSASMGYGQPRQDFSLETQAVTLNINKPEELHPGQFALATKKMIVEVSYYPDIEKLKVGDAFERTITISAQDVPDLLLPNLSVDERVSTFRVYRSEPVLSEKKVNGNLIASRVEKENFVARNEGKTILPEKVFYWFDITNQNIQKEIIAAKTITILPNPLLDIKNTTIEKKISTERLTDRSVWYLLGLMILALLIIYYWLYRNRNLSQSDIAFRQLKKACLKGDRSQVYQQFYRWAGSTLTSTRPLLLKNIYQEYPELKVHLLCLEHRQINEKDVCDFKALLKEVTIIQKQISIRQNSDNNELLLTLNPR